MNTRFTEEQIHDGIYSDIVSAIFDTQDETGNIYILDKDGLRVTMQTIIYDSIKNPDGGIPLDSAIVPLSMVDFIERIKYIRDIQLTEEKMDEDTVIKCIETTCDCPFIKDLIDNMHHRLQEFYNENHICKDDAKLDSEIEFYYVN